MTDDRTILGSPHGEGEPGQGPPPPTRPAPAAFGPSAGDEVGPFRIVRTLGETFRPFSTLAAARRSDMREFVHEPTNTTSIFCPAIGLPASRPM